MSTITTGQEFRKTLDSLTLQQQRVIGARFINNVLGLTQNNQLIHAQQIAAKSDSTAEELSDNYHSIHSIYVKINSRSGFHALDWKKQAEHFVAEACLTCFAPSYEEATTHHLTLKVAMYCQMARMRASINHEGAYPIFVS